MNKYVNRNDHLQEGYDEINDVLQDQEPKRFALVNQPPTLVVEYLVPSSGKLYHHKIKLRKFFKQNMDSQDILENIRENHYLYISESKVKDTQILSLIDRLRNNQVNLENEKATSGVKGERNNPMAASHKSDIQKQLQDVDLNKMKPEEVKKKKELMDHDFNKNLVKPEDPHYVWDQQVEFEEPEDYCDWD